MRHYITAIKVWHLLLYDSGNYDLHALFDFIDVFLHRKKKFWRGISAAAFVEVSVKCVVGILFSAQ
jgi:hypothetical protein